MCFSQGPLIVDYPEVFLMALEILYFALVLLRGIPRGEGAQVPAPPGFGILLA